MDKIKILLLIICAIISNYVKAYDLSYYTSNSKFNSGKWIKIKISETGIYEITNDEIKNFGFTDPQNVHLYGYGGTMLPETFSDGLIDDIEQVPVLRTGDKIIFYGQGPVSINITSPTAATPRYIQNVNSYSKYGYYFLSDIQTKELPVRYITNEDNGVYEKDISYNYYYHEKEEISLSTTGKQFLGEDMTAEKKIKFNFKLPGLVENEKIIVNVGVAMSANATGYINTVINGEDVAFQSNSNAIKPPVNQYIYYNYCAPFAAFQPKTFNEDISLETSITCTGIVKTIKFDYLMLTYKHHNRLSPDVNQLKMGFQYMSKYDKILVSNSNENTIVWNIDNPSEPVQYSTSLTPGTDGSYTMSFSPKITGYWNQFIAFNKNETLKKVEFDSEVENQNLHNMPVPDMVIISPPGFCRYAEIIANHHREEDKIDVAVIEHSKIFNEFSSGTPDPSAYRRFNKMLYDKDRLKYKYLLLFGTGSYDNRKILGNKGDNLLMTYQSTVSNDESISYTTDDYFGFLDDNSGVSISSDQSRLCIGRMPVETEEEAQSTVDKLLDYLNNKSYDYWRDNILIIADEGDDDLHMFQAEGIQKLISDTLKIPFQTNKIFIEAYPRKDNYAVSANTKIKDLLTKGQIFATYIGHGNPNFLTKQAHILSTENIKNLSYKNMPVFSFATCDVGRFDDDIRGIAEIMFQKPDGGAIACFTSTRTVKALDNNALNSEFIRNLFSKCEDGNYRTIGEAFRNSKYIFNSTKNINKLNFILFGDPAMKLHYPEPFIKVETLNNNSIDGNDIPVNPMTDINITGEILNGNGEIDSSFNGVIYLSLYDKARFYKDVSFNNGINIQVHKSFFQNDELNRVQAGVKNGTFNISCMIPRNCQASNEKIAVRLYAYNPENGNMATGSNSNTLLKPYDESIAVKDNTPPFIKSMYIDNPDFTDGGNIVENGTFYAEFEDESGINSGYLPIGSSMSILIDGNNSYRDICNYFNQGEDNKSGTVEFPLKNLSYGYHTITFNVSDIAGNRTSKSISFYVKPANSAALITVEETPARRNTTFNISHSLDDANLEIKLIITDSKGEKVWSKQTSSSSVNWDLTNSKGEKVEDGIYYYHAIIENGSQYGYTENKKIIVLKQ